LYGRLCTLKQEGNEPWRMGTGSRTADHPFEVLARRWGRSIAVGCDPWMIFYQARTTTQAVLRRESWTVYTLGGGESVFYII